MKIKHALYAMAMLLLPLSAMAQVVVPTPAQGQAIIAVSKFFDNSASRFMEVGIPVTINIQCDGGSVSPAEKVDVYPQFGKYETSFTIFNFGPDQELECKVWEEPIDGYTASYDCLWGAYDNSDYYAAHPAANCVDYNYTGINGTASGPSSVACTYETIVANTSDGEEPSEGSQAGCTIFNDVDPVEIEVTKVWEVYGQPGEAVSDTVKGIIKCDAPMSKYAYGPQNSHHGKGKIYFELSGSDYFDEDGKYTGVGVATAWVYPEWYPTAPDPDDQEYTECTAEEFGVASAVEVDNGCEEPMEIAIGGSKGTCTITNTLFFEGIPTLSQYGLAIMALLMLGVGFVGFRRFV